jgi:hypothetical protein
MVYAWATRASTTAMPKSSPADTPAPVVTLRGYSAMHDKGWHDRWITHSVRRVESV